MKYVYIKGDKGGISMQSICLIGGVDKRIISYPLIKCLGLMGKTLVVTDDSIYRRFGDNYELEFEKGQVDFKVLPKVPVTVSGLGVTLDAYEYVLYITTNELIKSDKVVYCHGLEKAMATREVQLKLEDIEHVDITLTMSKVEKGILAIGYSKEAMEYICNCEEHKEFVPCNGASFTTLMCTLFDDVFKMSKDNMRKLLARRD